MRFADLVGFTKSYGEKKADLLIVIPFYKNYEALSEHLERLSRQTYGKFDVLIVLNSVSDENIVMEIVEKGKSDFSITLVKRKEDTGSSGGFFCGEKYVLENGYSSFILADDDCMPGEDRLVEKLLAEHDKGRNVPQPRIRYMLDGEFVFTGTCAHMYSLYDSALLKETGLHYYHLYIGADDSEFQSRVRRFRRLELIDSTVIHPARHSIFANFDRSLLYRTNDMLFFVPDRFLYYLYNFSFFIPCYLILGGRRTRSGGMVLLKNILMHRFGKDALKDLPEDQDRQVPERFDLHVVPYQSPEKNRFFFDYSKKNSINELVGFARAVARKRVLLSAIPNFAVLICALLAEETWVSHPKEKYLLTKNGSLLSHIVKMILFLLSLSVTLPLGILSFLISWIRRPKTLGFGL